MRLLTFEENGVYRMGVWTTEGIVDVQAAAAEHSAIAADVPITIHAVLSGGEPAKASLETFVAGLLSAGESSAPYLRQEDTLVFGPCVTEPQKIICIGLNYRKHAEETNMPIPTYPILFNKFANTLTGHDHDVPLPRTSNKVDYEAELAIVIGKKAKYVSEEDALDYVYGYSASNDLSARDLQMRTSQWLAGKSCDKFSPVGPYLVSKDEVGNPNDLAISCTVNGEVRQHSNTSDMIFNCQQIVSYISECMTLLPGDVILTGTPEGVVLGYPPEKQIYLKPGDVVTIEIEKLGAITNRMVSEREE